MSAFDKQYITITKEEYDELCKAANSLMVIFNTDPIYLDKTVAAAKKAIIGVAVEGGAFCGQDTCICRD